MSKPLTVAISITTHNRVDDLKHSLERLAELDPLPDEIIIGADNCSDGTVEMVESEYPQYTLLVSDSPQGSIATRDRIVKTAQSDIVLSLDDDSYPVETHFLAEVAALFAQHEDLGLVAFPQRSDEYPETLEQTDFGPHQWIGSYPNSGAAFRRSLYLELPGYPTFFFHAYEEPDFALQIWNAGYKVLHYTELTIRHHWTAVQRDEGRTHRRHARNEFLSMVIRCPGWLLLPLILFRGLSQLRYAFSRGLNWVWREPQWWREALGMFGQAWAIRKPIPTKQYWAWMKLVRSGQIAELDS